MSSMSCVLCLVLVCLMMFVEVMRLLYIQHCSVRGDRTALFLRVRCVLCGYLVSESFMLISRACARMISNETHCHVYSAAYFFIHSHDLLSKEEEDDEDENELCDIWLCIVCKFRW